MGPLTPGFALFAASLIASGAAAAIGGHPAGILPLAAGALLLWQPGRRVAVAVLVGYLLFQLVLFKLRLALASSATAVVWESCGETVLPLAASCALCARATSPTRAVALRAARCLAGAALLAFGIAHFAYVTFTAALVPHWLPQPVWWVYLTGASYCAAGAALLATLRPRLAAALATVQIAAFTLLIWLPAITRPGADRAAWQEATLSLLLTASAWVIAEA